MNDLHGLHVHGNVDVGQITHTEIFHQVHCPEESATQCLYDPPPPRAVFNHRCGADSNVDFLVAEIEDGTQQ